jgi:streptomycin 6-kinase
VDKKNKNKALALLKTKDYEKENLPESETMHYLKGLRVTNIYGYSDRHILLLKHIGTTAATQKPYSLAYQLGISK